ncbi:MAG: carbamate kinase [Thermoplasmatales archaeon]|jgi:carbamate kinase|nr:carbamate kinase [Candidatus Thermoplasmatota archaeon]MCL6002630.1 carbamate kinase [Candidatus Thermoplasmatota archaeon]MDA8055909.1 carbamate kinase [Thermoplasmatales archaeon]
MRATLAVGGNALLEKYDRGTAEEQISRAEATARKTYKFFKDNDVVLTHGNGPQVGAILLQNEFSSSISPAMPLDVCGAMSQGNIGYFLQTSFQKVFNETGVNRKVVTLITRTVVEGDDPAFRNPTKPVGKYYTRDEARVLEENNGFVMKEDAGRGYRRVVPSPIPIDIVEIEQIRYLMNERFVPIAVGGGGIPVVKTDGGYAGVEAVIDKDLASSLIAVELDVDSFIILTAVDSAYINFNKPNKQKLGTIDIEEIKKLRLEGHFAAGSMLPKIDAAINFVSKTGRKAIITNADNMADALAGKAGTIITA